MPASTAKWWKPRIGDATLWRALRRFREADLAFEDAKANHKDGLQNAFDGELFKLRGRLETETDNIAQIRRLLAEAQGIERTMNDSIEDEIARQIIWQRTNRDRNCAVRTTPAPDYFKTYPEFNELRQKRLNLGDLQAVAQHAEDVLAQNRSRLAEL